jgi:hypothetical protein
MESISFKTAAQKVFDKYNSRRGIMAIDTKDAFELGVEFCVEKVDEFLRLHPEYRCLDVIGKFKQYINTKK